MSKAIQKVSVRCPHCSAEQWEPEMAKSTFCRKCSEYFAITPAVLAGAPVVPAIPKASPATPKPPTDVWAPAPAVAREPARTGAYVPANPPASAPAAGGLREKLGGFLASKPKTRTAHCFECTSWHEISSSAQSTTCKACGAYIDLQDYKINGGFSRNIKTRGTLYLGSKGDLSSSKILCEQATIHGKMRGNLTCLGKVTIRVQGRLYGSLEAGQLIVEKGSEVIFSRPIRASSVEVHGAMTGQIVSDSHVTREVGVSKANSRSGRARRRTRRSGDKRQRVFNPRQRCRPSCSVASSSLRWVRRRRPTEAGAIPPLSQEACEGSPPQASSYRVLMALRAAPQSAI